MPSSPTGGIEGDNTTLSQDGATLFGGWPNIILLMRNSTPTGTISSEYKWFRMDTCAIASLLRTNCPMVVMLFSNLTELGAGVYNSSSASEAVNPIKAANIMAA